MAKGKQQSPSKRKKYPLQFAITLKNKARNIAKAKKLELKYKNKKVKRSQAT